MVRARIRARDRRMVGGKDRRLVMVMARVRVRDRVRVRVLGLGLGLGLRRMVRGRFRALDRYMGRVVVKVGKSVGLGTAERESREGEKHDPEKRRNYWNIVKK
eukprot:1139843-Amorphochlora_amoeboformis.AAC.1